VSASQDNVKVCRILVESKADVTSQDYCFGSSDTPLDVAIKCGTSGVVAYLRKVENLANAGTSSKAAVPGFNQSKCVVQ
jgi:hypothetical protein